MAAQTLREDGVSVQKDGRIELVDDVLDHLGLGAGEMVAVTLFVENDEEETKQFNRRLDSRRRFVIPHTIRHEHGIEKGDRVDLEVGVP